jgi:wyosine [tRNA(Phe)-imidazoG37] synthetase (radical SAM superfamily)
MEVPGHRITFGPIPSRRLGRSLGVNNIPAKTCSYDCRYCQVGPTTELRLEPKPFFTPEDIRDAVAAHLQQIRRDGQGADHLTISPDGEPTLDSSLGEDLQGLGEFGIPIAMFTNASLLWRADVRARVGRADLVSVKVDSVLEGPWRTINRPHPALELAVILGGIREFAAGYQGILISETMLVDGVNDSEASLSATADFLASIAPRTAFLAVPIRPPAVPGTFGPDESGLLRAYQAFSARLPNVELLTGHEVGDFAHTGDAAEDLLAITAVHPMREAAVRRLLEQDHSGWDVVDQLLALGSLSAVEYAGDTYYLPPARRPSAPLG